MFKWLGIVFRTLRAAIRCRNDLAAENLALRQQLAVMKHQHPRPRLTDADRYFWVALSMIWSGRTHPIEGRYNLPPVAESSYEKWTVGYTTNTCE